MARAPLLPCSVPGCPQIAVQQGRCAEHQRVRPPAKPRPSSTARGYDRKWRRVRAMFLRRHPACELCGGEATEVHHMVPLAEGGTHAWANLQPLCKRCHSRVTAGGGHGG